MENAGQFDAEVRFRTLSSPPAAAITDRGIVFTQLARGLSRDAWALGHNVRLRFESSTSSSSRAVATAPAGTHASYFRGADPSHWFAGARCWQAVALRDVARGVSVEVRASDGRVEYDVCASPEGRIEDLVVVVDGAEDLAFTSDGGLDITTPLGHIHQGPPRTWQTAPDGAHSPLACWLERLGPDRFGFRTPDRDGHATLTVDPEVVYSTFVEGSATEAGVAIAVDATGAAYVAGSTQSADFPVTPGAFDTAISPGAGDAVIFKLAPDGGSLEFATFLGGTNSFDDPDAIVVDQSGQAVIVGQTSALDFPTTAGAYSTTLNGPSDAYVARINDAGTALVFSTLFGGAGNDDPNDVAIDGQGRVIVAGSTTSADLPTTSSAFQPVKPAPSPVATSGFIARLSSDATSLTYCSYFGGSLGDRIEAMAVGPNDSMFIGGMEGSGATFPTTPGAFQTRPAGSGDAFVAKFSAEGDLIWSTLLGGTDEEWFYSLVVDGLGQAHAAGYTWSSNFPTTAAAFDPSFDGLSDGYVTKLAVDGSSLVYSTRIGGSKEDDVRSLALGADGSCYAMGHTRSINFPTTPDALVPSVYVPTAFDPYVVHLSKDGAQLLYGTIFGGPNNKIDDPRALAVDPSGRVSFTGYTLDPAFPTTPGAFDTTLSGSNGLFVVQLDLSPWSDIGDGLAAQGNSVPPALSGAGGLQPQSAGEVDLVGAHAGSPCFLLVGLTALSAPFKGGTLVPVPQLLLVLLTDGQGAVSLSWTAWPSGVPAGTKVYMQAWIPDIAGLHGWTASNALLATTPVIEQ